MRHRENDYVEVADGAQLTLLDRDMKGNSKSYFRIARPWTEMRA